MLFRSASGVFTETGNIPWVRVFVTVYAHTHFISYSPNMYIHFRTEDSYQVVALQVGGGQRRGVSYPRDGGGLALAAQVLQPQDLEAYVLAQIHGALSGESL